jgi:hypothetical protein
VAEYVLQPGDDPGDVAKQLIEAAGPENVHWFPRPDVPGGGVFQVNDEEAIAGVARTRAAARDAETRRIEEAQAAADERDAKADETGMTPHELGFPANAGTDPGSVAEAERNAEVTGDADPEGDGEEVEADDEPVAVDDPAAAEDESKMTPAQRRAARRKAAAEAAGEPATEEGK